MIVDCGNSTIDLTTRKLVRNDPLQLGKVTAHIRDIFGGNFIDNEIIKFLREILGACAIDQLIENHYGQLQYMVEIFHQRIIGFFAGDNMEFQYCLDIEEYAPNLLQYISEETRKIMEDNQWIVDINYNDIRKILDTFIDRIIRLIHVQLSNNKEICSAIFITGEHCEIKYLQNRIREEFNRTVKTISVPVRPIIAIERGSVIYGLSIISNNIEFDDLKFVISSRILKYTYGIQYNGRDIETRDSKNRKYKTLVKRGTKVTSDDTFSFNFKPESNQTIESFAIYYTQNYDVEYSDELGMKLLGILNIDLLGKSK
jgi:hypothetical protein